MAVGVMMAVALCAVISAAVAAAGFSTVHPHPIGWHVLIGAAIFGFGIVFTGGCASGSLYKAGEGIMGSMLVIVAISFSQAIFVAASGWFDRFVPAPWVASAAAKDMPEELSVQQGWFDLFTTGYIWDMKGSTLAATAGATDPIVANSFSTSTRRG